MIKINLTGRCFTDGEYIVIPYDVFVRKFASMWSTADGEKVPNIVISTTQPQSIFTVASAAAATSTMAMSISPSYSPKSEFSADGDRSCDEALLSEAITAFDDLIISGGDKVSHSVSVNGRPDETNQISTPRCYANYYRSDNESKERKPRRGRDSIHKSFASENLTRIAQQRTAKPWQQQQQNSAVAVESDAELEIRKICDELHAAPQTKLAATNARCESIPLMDDLIEDLILFAKQFEETAEQRIKNPAPHQTMQASSTLTTQDQTTSAMNEKLLYINNAAGLRVAYPIIVSIFHKIVSSLLRCLNILFPSAAI